ncbi:hypothetical protein L195_g015907 [Trifolium pratense]|uniref:Uncharacterized protein n=1 Tax=Trifolium pratense TaxID=57577 RepID=A0A2K3MPR2_TRIPR|nr:hypothetical protein L195_g015907 [Trifolium pratense]
MGQTLEIRDTTQQKPTQRKDIDPSIQLTMLQENREVVNIFPAVMQPTDPTVLHPASPFMGGVPTILRPPAPAMGASDSPQILGSPNRPLEANGKEENVCSTIHGEEDEVALETQNLEDENMVT